MRRLIPYPALPVLMLLLFPFVSAQQKYKGCFGANAKIAIGEKTMVCLQVGNNVDWTAGVEYVRAAFEPSADQYSKFHIPNSYKDFVGNPGTTFKNSTVVVGAASQNALSFLRVFYDPIADDPKAKDEDRKIYPFLTAIINVNKGNVTGITWDNACVFCGGFAEACQENTYNYNGVPQDQQTSGQPTKGCFIRKSECEKIAKENEGKSVADQNTSCDLTLYVVWSGTDVNGKALQSQAFRFSEFPIQNIEDAITQVIPTFGFARRRATEEGGAEEIVDL